MPRIQPRTSNLETYLLLTIAYLPLPFLDIPWSTTSWLSTFSKLGFYNAIVLAVWLVNRCFTPPDYGSDRAEQKGKGEGKEIERLKERGDGKQQGEEKKEKEKDTISPLTSTPFLLVAKALVTAISLYHGLISLTLTNSPSPTFTTTSPLCLNSSNLNPALFTITPYATFLLLLTIISASLRLLAFAQLRENFTFQLSTPNRLVTTGLYAWVRHPSYTFLVLTLAGLWGVVGRRDGVVGCLFEFGDVGGDGEAGWGVGRGSGGFWWNVAVGSAVMVAMGMTVFRVRDEERLLEREFRGKGVGWEEWVNGTWRFVPWVF